MALLEGMVAGVSLTSEEIADQLARRRLGYGRGARMKFERDQVTMLAGVRRGVTLGGPIAIEIGNTEWPKWETVMAADPVDPAELGGRCARNAPLTRPRPGHADYAGMLKYGFDDARPVLERASARETAARVAAGTVARQFLRASPRVEVLSHVLSIGESQPSMARRPGRRPGGNRRQPGARLRQGGRKSDDRRDRSRQEGRRHPRRCGGGRRGRPAGGLGSFTSGDNRLDSQLAAAVMGIQAIKGVEIGDGFTTRAGAAAAPTTRCTPAPTVSSARRTGPAAWKAA